MHEAERGLFDLRRGRPLYVTAPNGPAPQAGVLLATVESLSRQTLDQLRKVGGGQIRLALTHHRARAMGLTNGHERSVSVGLNGETVDQILRLSSAIGNFATKTLDLREASPAELGGLTLARLGGLLPAIVSTPAVLSARPNWGTCWKAAQFCMPRLRRSRGWPRTREWTSPTSATDRFRSRTPRMPPSYAFARPIAFSSTSRLSLARGRAGRIRYRFDSTRRA